MFNTISTKRAMLKNDKGQYYSFLTGRFADFDQEMMEAFISTEQEIKNMINFLEEIADKKRISSKKYAQRMIGGGLHIIYVNLIISVMVEGDNDGFIN